MGEGNEVAEADEAPRVADLGVGDAEPDPKPSG